VAKEKKIRRLCDQVGNHLVQTVRTKTGEPIYLGRDPNNRIGSITPLEYSAKKQLISLRTNRGWLGDTKSGGRLCKKGEKSISKTTS